MRAVAPWLMLCGAAQAEVSVEPSRSDLAQTCRDITRPDQLRVMGYLVSYLGEIDRGDIEKMTVESRAAPRLPVEHTCF